jgi:hypothetical protein
MKSLFVGILMAMVASIAGNNLSLLFLTIISTGNLYRRGRTCCREVAAVPRSLPALPSLLLSALQGIPYYLPLPIPSWLPQTLPQFPDYCQT